MAEMDDFATDIRQVTQGRGSYLNLRLSAMRTLLQMLLKIIEKAKADSQE